ncbi:LOW QUALITY PROTEIN: coiled-coil domain-containing protein 40 [Macrobrachium rosenbergii]|uniref:LOW QUALITY PROTEIN: coiled-coil domain-containing protein 40 n=1 Tax=Macrobrachium rosenbergii TaxID=79674 RepID=UPI0034D6627F
MDDHLEMEDIREREENGGSEGDEEGGGGDLLDHGGEGEEGRGRGEESPPTGVLSPLISPPPSSSGAADEDTSLGINSIYLVGLFVQRLSPAKVERQKTCAARLVAQESLQQARQEENTLLQTLHQARKHESHLKQEISSIGARVAAIKAAKEQSDGDVTTLERALHNTAWDRANLEKDKMAQDVLVERLMASLERERTTLTSLDQASAEVAELTEALQQRARLQQDELQQLELEAVGVRRAWEANVLVLERRSQEQSEAQQHLQQLLAQHAGLRTELYNTRKAVREMQMKHEAHSVRLLYHEREVTTRRIRLATVRDESHQLAERHEGLANVVEHLEAQHRQLLKEAHEETRRLEGVYRRLRSATERHRRLEDLALDKVGEHTAISKSADNIRRRIKEIRQKCRNLEDELIERERSAADAALKASDGRAAVLAQTANRDAAKLVVEKLDADIVRLESDLRRGQEKISANQCAVDRINKDLVKALEIAGGSEAPPAEREERRLRTLLRDREAEKTALEEEALTVQRHLLEAQQNRERLVQNLTRLNQELNILRSRLTRLEGNVETERNGLRDAVKTQQRLHSAVATLDARLHQEKTARETLSRESDASETQLMAKLKELNEEANKREKEMMNLRKTKEEVEGKVLDASRIRTEWERNLVEIKDARDALRKETGTEGDLHAMKTEINRMQARWRALEATQKELASQLEQSVSVEAALKGRAMATIGKLRRDPNSAKATRLMHQDILKRKITKSKRHLSEIQSATESAKQERSRLEEECNRKERLYAQNVRLLQEAAQHLEEKLVKKQEEQLRLQEQRARLRHLTAVKEGRYKTLAAPSDEAQLSLKARLVARAQAYTGIITQLEAGYPQLELKLKNIKFLLHNFLEG